MYTKTWEEVNKITGKKFNQSERAWKGLNYKVAKELMDKGYLTDATHDHGMTIGRMVQLLKEIPKLRANAIPCGLPGDIVMNGGIIDHPDKEPIVVLASFERRYEYFDPPTLRRFLDGVIDYADDFVVRPDLMYAWFD